MAVTKLWPVKSRLQTVVNYVLNEEKTVKGETKYSDADYQALRDVIAYAQNEEKTEQEYFCSGINCSPLQARDQFVVIKKRFGKSDGIQAYHGYISFKEQDITPECAHKIGMEFAQRVWGHRFQIVVATHLNTQHLHCHFVINSVSFIDGKRLQGEEKAWFKFREIADEICQKYNLHTIEKPERNPDAYHLTKKEEAGMPTRYSIARAALDEAIGASVNVNQLEQQLYKMGYSLGCNPNHKYWTIRIKDDPKPIRLYRLGENYTKARILERLEHNLDNRSFMPFQIQVKKPKQYKLPTGKEKAKKVGGLYGLYLYYCYQLGTLPKYKPVHAQHVHPALRPDLMKLDELTAQTTLLWENHIGDTQQLDNYQKSVESKIKALAAERIRLRNKIRRVDVQDDKLSTKKSEIQIITDKIKQLRKEVRLCNGIAERSGIIKETLEQIETEERTQNRKENRFYEHER